MSDFTGQTEKMPCEHSYALINELEAFKTLIFDASEVRTLKALVRDHKSLTARLAEAEWQLKIYKKAVERIAAWETEYSSIPDDFIAIAQAAMQAKALIDADNEENT